MPDAKKLFWPAIAAGAVMLLWTLLLFSVFTPETLPHQYYAKLYTVMHEGNTGRLLDAIYGISISAGSNFYFVQKAIFNGDLLPAWYVMHMNIWLSGLSLIMAAVYAYAILKTPVFAFLAIVLYVRNPLLLNNAVSESALALAGFYMFASMPVFVYLESPPAGKRAKWLAVSGVLCFGLLSAMTELETFIIWFPACICAIMKTLGKWDAFERYCADLPLALWNWSKRFTPRIAFIAILLITALAWRVGFLMEENFSVHVRNSFDAVNLLQLSFLTLPVVTSHLLSIGATIFFVIGIVSSFRNWGRFFLLPLTTLLLYQACWSAAHYTFNGIFRTTPVLLPAIFLGIAYGLFWLERLAIRNKALAPTTALCTLLLLIPAGGGGTRKLLAGTNDHIPDFDT